MAQAPGRGKVLKRCKYCKRQDYYDARKRHCPMCHHIEALSPVIDPDKKVVKYPRGRSIWKTFYAGRNEARILEAYWQNFPSSPNHTMTFPHGSGIIETNLPVRSLRALFRAADVAWIDYVSDTKPASESD